MDPFLSKSLDLESWLQFEMYVHPRILQQNRVMVTITRIQYYTSITRFANCIPFFLPTFFFVKSFIFNDTHDLLLLLSFSLEKGRAKATKKAYECHITSSSWWIQSCWASSPWDYFRVWGRWLGNLTPQNSCVILQDWFSLDSHGKVIGQNCKKKKYVSIIQ